MRMISTIGYEGATLEDFIVTLQLGGIQSVLDVREIAQSRRRGFSKNQLATALGEAGISYTHIRQLGDPKAGREAARRGDIAEFQNIFEDHLELTETKAALQIAADLANLRPQYFSASSVIHNFVTEHLSPSV